PVSLQQGNHSVEVHILQTSIATDMEIVSPHRVPHNKIDTAEGLRHLCRTPFLGLRRRTFRSSNQTPRVPSLRPLVDLFAWFLYRLTKEVRRIRRIILAALCT